MIVNISTLNSTPVNTITGLPTILPLPLKPHTSNLNLFRNSLLRSSHNYNFFCTCPVEIYRNLLPILYFILKQLSSSINCFINTVLYINTPKPNQYHTELKMPLPNTLKPTFYNFNYFLPKILQIYTTSKIYTI